MSSHISIPHNASHHNKSRYIVFKINHMTEVPKTRRLQEVSEVQNYLDCGFHCFIFGHRGAMIAVYAIICKQAECF